MARGQFSRPRQGKNLRAKKGSEKRSTAKKLFDLDKTSRKTTGYSLCAWSFVFHSLRVCWLWLVRKLKKPSIWESPGKCLWSARILWQLHHFSYDTMCTSCGDSIMPNVSKRRRDLEGSKLHWWTGSRLKIGYHINPHWLLFVREQPWFATTRFPIGLWLCAMPKNLISSELGRPTSYHGIGFETYSPKCGDFLQLHRAAYDPIWMCWSIIGLRRDRSTFHSGYLPGILIGKRGLNWTDLTSLSQKLLSDIIACLQSIRCFQSAICEGEHKNIPVSLACEKHSG